MNPIKGIMESLVLIFSPNRAIMKSLAHNYPIAQISIFTIVLNPDYALEFVMRASNVIKTRV